MTPFATTDDLTNFWMQPTNLPRANFLLILASNRLRLIGSDLGINIDALSLSTPAYASTLQWVVLEAVKRALLMPTDAAPANSIQQTAGPYSENIVFTNPSGDLWFKKTELYALRLYGRQHLNSITTAYPELYLDDPFATDSGYVDPYNDSGSDFDNDQGDLQTYDEYDGYPQLGS